MTDQDLAAYDTHRRCSRQWRRFIAVFAREAVAADRAGVLALMRTVGVAAGEAQAPPPSATLMDSESAMNRIWDEQDWGFVRLREDAGALEVEHHAAPLPSQAGAEVDCIAAYLEGVYEAWFRRLGAPDHLRVRRAANAAGQGALRFTLAGGDQR